MVHATGMSLDPKKSKNTTCRRLFLVCRKVATVLRKSVRKSVRTVRLGRRFDRGHLRGIGWTHMNRKYKYKLELFEVRVRRTPFEVGAPFQVGELFSTSSWRSFQVQVLFDFKLALFSSSSGLF